MRNRAADSTSRQSPYAKRAGRLADAVGLVAIAVAWASFVIVLSVVTALLVGKRAHGGEAAPGAAACSVIRDPDERHMCTAVTQHLRSECEFIRQPDLRELCRVRVDQEKR